MNYSFTTEFSISEFTTKTQGVLPWLQGHWNVMLYEIKDSINDDLYVNHRWAGRHLRTFKLLPECRQFIGNNAVASKIWIIANNGPILAHGCEIKSYIGPMLGQCCKIKRAALVQRWANRWQQRWANEQSYVGPMSFANVGPMFLTTVGQRWANVSMLSGYGSHMSKVYPYTSTGT